MRKPTTACYSHAVQALAESRPRAMSAKKARFTPGDKHFSAEVNYASAIEI